LRLTHMQASKQILEETGMRVSDFDLQKVKTLGHLRRALVDQYQPKKTTQQLRVAESIQGLGNVQVYSRRRTPIHKQKEIGRWKLIEQELQERGLPVTGHTTDVKRQILLSKR